MNEAQLAELEATIDKKMIGEIANVIRRDWKKPYFGAIPYMDAMLSMNKIEDKFGADDGKSIVIYFLSNANTWRGNVARVVKKELKRRAGIK